VLALRGGRVLTPAGWSTADLLVDGPVLAAEGEPDEVLDVSGCVVAPGLVDLHVHAAGGFPAQGLAADLAGMAGALAAGGVTSFLATGVTAPLAELADLIRAVADHDAARPGARCAGVHLEGPWLSAAAAGAQPRQHLRPIDLAEAVALVGTGPVACVTVAPDLPGALDLVRLLVERGIRVSLGHSTASYDEARAAIDAGATGVTHCFNAMSQLSSREPGLVGAAMTQPELLVEVIADGVHVHPGSVRALYDAKGPEGVALVSDGVDGAAGSDVLRRDGDVLRLPDGTIAGSALTLSAAVRNVIGWGIPLEDALAMASTTPARALGLDVDLTPGNRADVVVLDDALQVRTVLVGGVVQ
jgi:N-acetylglucosamine-6-phosphate deacetylase